MALAANALTSVAAVAAEMGITSPTPADTAALERAINTVSGAIERFCGRSFARATVTELVPGFGRARLCVRRTPVISVTSIAFNGGSATDASTYEVESADAGFIRSKAGVWGSTADWSAGPAPELAAGTERPLFSVVYLGGFTLPASGDGYSLPSDIEQAAVISATALRRSSGKDTKLITYRNSSVLPDAALSLLLPWRRVL